MTHASHTTEYYPHTHRTQPNTFYTLANDVTTIQTNLHREMKFNPIRAAVPQKEKFHPTKKKN